MSTTVDGGAEKRMPLYQCSKQVEAFLVAKFEMRSPADDPGIGGWITPAEPGYLRFAVPEEYVRKHNPTAGGFFIRYKDGYCSWSPAKAFVEGYDRIA